MKILTFIKITCFFTLDLIIRKLLGKVEKKHESSYNEAAVII